MLSAGLLVAGRASGPVGSCGWVPPCPCAGERLQPFILKLMHGLMGSTFTVSPDLVLVPTAPTGSVKLARGVERHGVQSRGAGSTLLALTSAASLLHGITFPWGFMDSMGLS